MPTPEPIATPSMSDTVGLMKHSSSQLSAYSSASDLIASLSAVPAPVDHFAQVAAGAEGALGGQDEITTA